MRRRTDPAETRDGAQRALRVGVDGSCWSNRRGFGRFTRSLVPAMVAHGRHDYVLVIDEASLAGADVPEGMEVVPVRVSERPAEAASVDGSRRVGDVVSMSRAVRGARCDVVFFPATYSYFPVLGAPVVVTVHDALAEALPDLVLAGRRARVLWTVKQRLALLQARAVVTVSQASREAVLSRLRVDPRRLHVIREAPDPMFVPLDAGARAPLLGRLGLRAGDTYVLYVGGLSPHKNVGVLVQAFEEIAPDHPGLRLVVAGDVSGDPFVTPAAVAALRSRIASGPARDRILVTGFVEDDELVALYSGAVATVLPSLGEGFGLPAAESAACGTPVVASDIAALRELLGDAALYAPPADSAAFARALRTLLDAPGERERLAGASLRLAATWSWDAAAETVVSVLERSARTRGPAPASGAV
ncbi:MAG TPA: glycosyltransferase family 1 protein [Candidatus Dormibacteraeota bacterium]|nr:glycosyltransferase family 1 protein [Candidatus Dormibacteraeota bacterium]